MILITNVFGRHVHKHECQQLIDLFWFRNSVFSIQINLLLPFTYVQSLDLCKCSRDIVECNQTTLTHYVVQLNCTAKIILLNTLENQYMISIDIFTFTSIAK